MENTKKQFALEQIVPYFKNPELCGFDGSCKYETADGKMCVAGKNLLPEIRKEYKSSGSSVYGILSDFNSCQEKVFVPDAVDILDREEWNLLQAIHDALADEKPLEKRIDDLGLFTYDELVEFSKSN